jgi:hypothetical protein
MSEEITATINETVEVITVTITGEGDEPITATINDTVEAITVSISEDIGPRGKSAYEVAVDNGYVGSEAAWLATLVGAVGTTGATGAIGATGATGAIGAAAAETFESVAQNLKSYPITSTSFTEGVSLVKTLNSGAGTSITITLLFSAGLPITKTLSGSGVPSGIPTVCTYDFSGRVIPLTTYT